MSEEANLLAQIKEELGRINKKIDEQGQRLAILEKGTGLDPKLTAILNPSLRVQSSAENTAIKQEPASNAVAPKEARPMNLEENIGGKWFAQIGIVALVLGVSFLLKYAFDNNWIGPAGRVLIGIAIGTVLLGIGEKYIRRYSLYGQIITGGGLAVLYLSIFAAFNFYHLITQVPAFAIMVLITALGIFLSLRYKAVVLMMAAVIGGFATPILISTGENNAFFLFLFVLLLDLSILAVSVFKKWHEINFVGLMGTAILFIIWYNQFYSESQLMLTLFFLTAYFIIFSVSSLIFNLFRQEESTGTEQILSLSAATLYFGASYYILDADYHSAMGFFALLTGVYHLFCASLVKIFTPKDSKLFYFLALLAVAFITLAVPIQFKLQTITISWAIEAVLLFYLGIKINEKSIGIMGLFVFSLALFKSIFIDSGYNYDSAVIFNQVFGSYALIVAVAYISALLFRQYLNREGSDKTFKGMQVVALLIIAANFLTIFAGSREILFYYDKEVKALNAQNSSFYSDAARYGGAAVLEKNSLQAKKLRNKSSITLSIFWLIYSMFLLAAGFAGKYKEVRVGGIILLALAILKLFFYDLWSLGTLYRIISSISLGVVLLSISFAYQRYKEKILDIL